MPKITVIVTTYMLEKRGLVGPCFEGLLAQTMQDFDVLAFDDCSTDGTADKIRAYAERYPDKIRFVSAEKNCGRPALTRNAALDSGLVDGEYVLLLDGDDRMDPDYLELLLQRAEETGADIVVAAYDRVEGETGRVLCRELTWLPDEIAVPPQDDAVAFLDSALWNKLVRRSLFDEVRLPDIRAGEDLCCSLALFERAKRVACERRIRFHYQVWNGSLITCGREEDWFRFAELLADAYKRADPAWKEIYALASFLHIGLSMPLRVAPGPDANLSALMRRTRAYMKSEFHFYRGARYLTFSSLAKRGCKGVAIRLCLTAYRLGLFAPAVRAYLFLSRRLHREIKF